jgi:simple sugar transport system ATP-binding protein
MSDTATTNGRPLLEVNGMSKYFGSVIAIKDISMFVRAGEVTCLLGDNGAGKSTLIKTLSGVYRPDEGEYLFDGESMSLSSPRDALSRGIATVYQDLAMIPLMSIWRNFFLGSEPTRGWGPFRRYDVERARATTREEMGKMGIDIRDPDQAVGTLSGGERQSVAIARAVFFGARVLILDEPTAALGVKQAGVVLRYILQAKHRGIGVIFISHNPHHAYPVGDHFVILRRGQVYGDYAKDELALDKLVQMMAGGAELENLAHELERAATSGEAVDRELASAAKIIEHEAVGSSTTPEPVQAEAAPAEREATDADD